MIFNFRIDFSPVKVQIELFEEGNRLLYSITSINDRQLDRPVQRTRSSIGPIKYISHNERDAVKIPIGATHYCWLNGSDIVESVASNAEANEATMLLFGGLAYLAHDQSDNYHVIEIKRFQPTDSGRLQLNGPTKWRSEYTQALLDQDRFAVGFNYNIPFSTPLFYFYSHYSVVLI
jgi:hypothetical protein